MGIFRSRTSRSGASPRVFNSQSPAEPQECQAGLSARPSGIPGQKAALWGIKSLRDSRGLFKAAANGVARLENARHRPLPAPEREKSGAKSKKNPQILFFLLEGCLASSSPCSRMQGSSFPSSVRQLCAGWMRLMPGFPGRDRAGEQGGRPGCGSGTHRGRGRPGWPGRVPGLPGKLLGKMLGYLGKMPGYPGKGPGLQGRMAGLETTPGEGARAVRRVPGYLEKMLGLLKRMWSSQGRCCDGGRGC